MVSIDQLFEFDDEFIPATTEEEKLLVISKFPTYDHPHYYYRIAEAYIVRFDNYYKAKPYIEKTIEFGFNQNNIYSGTAFADSIGQCMLMYLQNENTSDLHKHFKLSCLCYVYFSQLIHKHGANAYNSLNSRALLVKNATKNGGIKKMLNDFYYSGPDLCVEMLTHGDFILATVGFKEAKELSNAEMSFKNAIEALNHLKAQPQYKNLLLLSDQQIAKLSIDNSGYLTDKLFDSFELGKFDIDI